MRMLVVMLVLGTQLTGCGLSERFDSAETRINAALPPDSGVQAARQLLLAQIADQHDVQKALEPKWASRLRLRALSCSRDYTPTWRDSTVDIRARLGNISCFAEYDRLLQRWVGLQRTRLMLAQGPIRPVTQALPPMITHREFITTMVVARDAPVAMFRGPSGFEAVDLANGKSIYKEAASPTLQGIIDLSPNGRLFTQATSGKISIRATEGGETLVELPQADGIIWLDDATVALRSNNSSSLRLLDLAAGEDTPIPGTGNGPTYMAARAPGAPSRFNLFVPRGADQIEIVNVGGRYEAQLRAEKRSSGAGFLLNTGGMSADGKMWIDGHQGVRVLNLDTLELDEHSFKPVGTQAAWPTPNPDEFLLSMHLPTDDGVSSHFNYYVYNYRAGTLAQVAREPGSSTRYQYIGSIKRLALIDNQNVRFIDKLPAGTAQPIEKALATFIDEMNQRRLAAAAARQLAFQGLSAPSGAPAVIGGAGTPAPLSGVGVATPLHTQLRDAQVEGVGVYQGTGARHGPGQTRAAGVVEVRIRRSVQPIALVLSSYEPVRWMIITESGAKLSAVLLSGYYDSTVVGAGAARVYRIGQGYAYGQPSSGYSELQRTVVQWTGKPITVFQGRYEGSNFSVGGG